MAQPAPLLTRLVSVPNVRRIITEHWDVQTSGGQFHCQCGKALCAMETGDLADSHREHLLNLLDELVKR